MSNDVTEFTRDVLSLSDDDRAHLAQLLWESLSETARIPSAADLKETAEEAARRDSELTTGASQPQSHAEAMHAAREAIR